MSNGGWLLVALAMFIGGMAVIVTALLLKARDKRAAANDGERLASVILCRTDHWDRAEMAVFIANLLGFGDEGYQFDNMRTPQLRTSDAYIRLVQVLEGVRLRYTQYLQVVGERNAAAALVPLLIGDLEFVRACAHDIEFIAQAALVASTATTPSGELIPAVLVPGAPTIEAFRSLSSELEPKTGFDCISF